jgi:hypothetical protein
MTLMQLGPPVILARLYFWQDMFQAHPVGCELVLCVLEPLVLPVPDPGKGVCADPVNRGAILEGEGPGPPSGDKERQLSPDKGRGKTWQNEEMAGSQGRLPLHCFRTWACTE